MSFNLFYQYKFAVKYHQKFHTVCQYFTSIEGNTIEIVENGKIKLYDPLKHYEKVKIHMTGKDNRIKVVYPVEICDLNIFINGNNNQVSIDEGLFGSINISLMYDNNQVIIGKNFRAVQCVFHLHGDKLCIGNNCMLSDNVQIWSDGHSILDVKSKQVLNAKPANIVIGDHVWLGQGARILKYAQIAADSIVAMNAVVTHQFEESNVILAGMPAKIVKRGITWDSTSPCQYKGDKK